MTALANHKTTAASGLDRLAGHLIESYASDPRAQRISHRYLPSREAIVEILESVLDLMYPGYFGRRDLNQQNLTAHVADSVAEKEYAEAESKAAAIFRAIDLAREWFGA